MLIQYVTTLLVMILAMVVLPIVARYFASLRTWYEGDPIYQVLKFLAYAMIPVFGLVGIAGGLGLPLYFFWKILGYLDETIQATNQMVTDPEKSIHLSDDLADVEREMNDIRHKNLSDQRAAKEAEQRKNDLIVYLAHDLRTPLTSVIGYLTLLREEPELSTKLRSKYTNIALEKAERLEQLIGEFFEITRFNLTTMTVTKESVDISMMLEQLSYEFLPVLQEKKLEWQLAIEPNILGMIDPEKMERAFDNLIRNAIHYSFSNSKIHLSVQQQDEQIKINITNEGRHIPPEKITRIFEPFYRADSARQSTTGGTGLGLPITKEIVELHEGTISAVSEENQISFTVLLPIS